ncbi:hypothetical protein [Singulisphaera sp. PoT]|uniref:hypothetical protein n=1 Tax=Singulisphaera sp. PoT TaxID=3411797 RepID=UPI003BF547E7
MDLPYLMGSILGVGLVQALFVNLAMMVVELFRMLRGDHMHFKIQVVLPVLSWPLAFAWMRADPGGLFASLMDG